MLFLALAVALWYAALSQGNGAAYALLFFLLSLAAVSWLHARQNLRGVRFRAGVVEPTFAGGTIVVPATVKLAGQRFVAGLEVRIAGQSEWVRVGDLSGADGRQISLPMKAELRGGGSELELELRSRWPIAIFTAKARARLEVSWLVYPAPAGAQPLPLGEAGWQYDRRRGRGDGDEFAGLRDIQPGESPRRIHWRAAERTDRLLIKEWEGASGGLRWLEWGAVEVVDHEARLSQLARWIFEAERTGTPYGLRMPGAEIPAGLGPAHHARCLKLLAEFPQPVAPVRRQKTSAATEGVLHPAPFGGILIALALAAIPILTTVYPFSAGLFGLALVFRYFTRKRGIALKSAMAKLFVCGVGAGGVLLSGKTLLGLEPGMSLVVGLMSLKVLESVTRRDFYVLMLLTWFLALCGLFISQTLLAGLAAMGLSLIAAVALAKLHGEDEFSWGVGVRRVGFMAVHALPILILLFIFFPRVQGGFRFSLNPRGQETVGFSEDLDPGSFAKLEDNFDTVFRVEFLDGEPPASVDRYWRGLVLWNCEGMRWRKGVVQSLEPMPRERPPGAFRQKITLQPHGERWLFALDHPIAAPKEALLESGAYLRADHRVNRSTRYEVWSVPGDFASILPREQRAAGLALPKNLSAKTRELGESFKVAGGDAATVAAAVQWFQRQGFTYNLAPDRYEGANALDQFLFGRKTGFCSHYAGSLAALLRVAGVPSRVVLGYQGGEYNPNGKYFQIRQNDAHAWTEVWLEGRGWHRVDLTQQLAPVRIENGAGQFRREVVDASGGGFRVSPGLREIFDSARHLWDSINYQWDLRVVAFDDDAQFEFLATTGLKDVPRPLLLGGIFTAAGVFFGLAGLWLRRISREKVDALGLSWRLACDQIRKISGVQREPWEGPMDYARRAAERQPGARAVIEDAARIYAEGRYGKPAGNSPARLAEARARLRRWKPARA